MLGTYQLGSYAGAAVLALAHSAVAAPLSYLPSRLTTVERRSLDVPIDTTTSPLFQTVGSPARAFGKRAGDTASSGEPSDGEANLGALGIVIPIVLVFLIILVVGLAWLNRRKRQRREIRPSRDLDIDDLLLADIRGLDSRERRARRGPRRDPLSRTSSGNTLRTLPQYTKDAGDEEVVLLRRNASGESRPGSISHWRHDEDEDYDDRRNHNSDRVSLDITDHRRSASWGQTPPYVQEANNPLTEPPLPPDFLSEEGARAARAAVPIIVTDGGTLGPPVMLQDHGSTSKLDTSSTYGTAPPSPASTATAPFVSVLSSPSNALNVVPMGSRCASPESMSSRSPSPAPLAPAQTVEAESSTPAAATPLFPSPTPYIPTGPLSTSDQPSPSPPPPATAAATATATATDAATGTTTARLTIPPPPPPADILSPDGFSSPDAPWRLSMPAALVTARHAVMAQAVTLSPRPPVPTLPPIPPVPTLPPVPAQPPTPTLPPSADPPIQPPAEASSSSSPRPETPAPPYVAKPPPEQPPAASTSTDQPPEADPSPEPESSAQRKRWSRRMGRRLSKLYGGE